FSQASVQLTSSTDNVKGTLTGGSVVLQLNSAKAAKNTFRAILFFSPEYMDFTLFNIIISLNLSVPTHRLQFAICAPTVAAVELIFFSY
ncbi:MAG TPA: hypothetical protein VMT35_15990, partial [Ignavibacteriaceae bacterium]|nr:hypothetical protein [Ignavibacteriaceae bacterium]